jgi:hypothetical protein
MPKMETILTAKGKVRLFVLVIGPREVGRRFSQADPIRENDACSKNASVAALHFLGQMVK